MSYQITNQRDLRQAFWLTHPNVSKQRGRDGDYLTDTRLAWCDYIEHLNRDGVISDALANRATLE